MNSKRLLSIASFIEKDDKVIDVGCDHGYLGIYLKLNNLCSDLLLTDLRASALNQAVNNIKKYHLDIKTLQTNGLNNIELDKYNTITISGMGTQTILEILSSLNNNNPINKIIIQSNNDLDILRKEMISMGYYLNDEITVNENNIYYIICKFTKNNMKISEDEIQFGIIKKDKKDYYEYLISYYQNILDKIPNNNKKDNIVIKNKIDLLNKLLKKCR